MSGAGKACPWGLPGGIGGAPPPGLFGIAGAGLPELGGGGGTRDPNEPEATFFIITMEITHHFNLKKVSQ